MWNTPTDWLVSVQRSARCRCWDSPWSWRWWTARLAGSVLADHVSHVCLVPPLQEETQCPTCGALVIVSSDSEAPVMNSIKYLKHQPHLLLALSPGHNVHSLGCVFSATSTRFYDISAIISLSGIINKQSGTTKYHLISIISPPCWSPRLGDWGAQNYQHFAQTFKLRNVLPPLRDHWGGKINFLR